MRGKGAGNTFNHRFFRITPAYAGKRHRTQAELPAKQDHPRLCGEKYQDFPRIE